MLALDMEEESVGLFLPAPFTKADPPLIFFSDMVGTGGVVGRGGLIGR